MDTPARPGRALAVLLAALLAGGAATAQAPAHKPKQALDDRADPHMVASEVGKGSHFARKPTAPGDYFSDRTREAVHAYYASHEGKPASHGAVRWEIGQPLPAEAVPRPVPRTIAGSLPKLPPGHRYMDVGGDILLVANGSKMVVDGIAAH